MEKEENEFEVEIRSAERTDGCQREPRNLESAATTLLTPGPVES